MFADKYGTETTGAMDTNYGLEIEEEESIEGEEVPLDEENLSLDEEGEETEVVEEPQEPDPTWITISGCVFDPVGKSELKLQDFTQNLFRVSLNNIINPVNFSDTDPIKVEVFTSAGLALTTSESHFFPSTDFREKVSTTLRIDTTLDEFEK